MKLYIECAMGASGDMLMAALYELLPDKEAFKQKMQELDLPGVTFEYLASSKCGISGTRIAVKVCGVEEKSEDIPHHNLSDDHYNNHDHGHNHGHEHAHEHNHGHQHQHHCHVHTGRRYSYDEILSLIKNLDLPKKIIENAFEVYKIIGEAEASVHGVSLESVHLHEIGSLDAVADVVGVCVLFDMLGYPDVTASPIHVGYGFVRCEHGILPVPAPAAAEILKGIPIYGGKIEGELCTPTGAALLKKFVAGYGEMPIMAVKKIGYGMGSKDFAAANCVRVFLTDENLSDSVTRETVFEISCNLDDMTPEAIGAALEVLFSAGALDVYTTPITMKKSRSAVILTCICTQDKQDELIKLMFKYTTTLGVRITLCIRDVLERKIETVTTEYGKVRIKLAAGFGVIKQKPEYEDVFAAAKKHEVAFSTVYDAAMHSVSTLLKTVEHEEKR